MRARACALAPVRPGGAGIARGKEVGHAEGHALGVQKGLELGEELGRYRGRVAALLAIYTAHPELASDRCVAPECVCPSLPSPHLLIPTTSPRRARASRMLGTLRRLDETLGRISLDDPRDQRCFDELEEARAKMRMVALWLRAAPPSAPADAPGASGAASAGGAAAAQLGGAMSPSSAGHDGVGDARRAPRARPPGAATRAPDLSF